jgi:hypothetical protein
MSIVNININDYEQDFEVDEFYKINYGEVRTDFNLIKKMYHLIDNDDLKNPNLKWLDPCCGKGYFMIILFDLLMISLPNIYNNRNEKANHIIKNMLYMVEINDILCNDLKELFGKNANIYNLDYLDLQIGFNPDYIIGNPPWNINGSIKPPCSSKKKKLDGKTTWQDFIIKSVHLLPDYGKLLMITPSIWMKKDYNVYSFITQFRLIIHTYNAQETNKLFHNQAQTPSSYFLLTKRPVKKNVFIYDNLIQKYIAYPINNGSLPLSDCYNIKQLIPFVKKYGYIKVNKTNVLSGTRRKNNKVILSNTESFETPYVNIKTCKQNSNKIDPKLILEYTSEKCPYADTIKLVLAHKMYGLPFYDKFAKYGISGRDNYVITNKNDKEFIMLYKFLSLKCIIKLFDATRYRMRYLEKYIFEMLPDITNIPDFPRIINEKNIINYFQLM